MTKVGNEDKKLKDVIELGKRNKDFLSHIKNR